MSDADRQTVLLEVQALLDRRRTAQAKARLKGALLEHPDDAELLLQSAWADYLDDDNAAALATVRQVLTRIPEDESARELLFELLSENNELSAAEDVIVQLLRDFPEHAPFYGKYAMLMIRAMHVEKARALAIEGLKYDAEDQNCLAAQTLCGFIGQRQEEATHALRQLLVRHPQSARTLMLVLIGLQQRGDYHGALRIAEELVRAQPYNEDIVEIAVEMKLATHWSMLPLWPLQRWGWGASAVLWLAAVVSVRFVSQTNPAAGGTLAICILIYVIYSWVWPPILRRWIARA